MCCPCGNLVVAPKRLVGCVGGWGVKVRVEVLWCGWGRVGGWRGGGVQYGGYGSLFGTMSVGTL